MASMNEEMNDAWKYVDKAFAQANKAFEQAEKLFTTATKAATTTSSTHIRINLQHKRFSTFGQLIKCAFEALLTGKTSVTVKRR